MTSPNSPKPTGWRSVLVAFAFAAGALTLVNVAALYQTLVVQTRVRELMKDALTSIQLLNVMQSDIYQRRLLLDAHIFESEKVNRARVEARLADVDADFAVAGKAYERTVTFPGEASAWQQLKTHVAATRAPIAEALALSQRDRDVEARAALLSLESRFAVIENDLANLSRINEGGAADATARVEGLQRSSMALLTILALGAAALTVIIGLRTVRTVRQREEQVARYSSLLETRNRDLDAFSGRVAHDLRGPLTTIATAASVLSMRTSGEEGVIATVHRAVAHMETLIADLLALSRIDTYARDGVCDPAPVAAQVRDDLAPRLEAAGGTLRVAVQSAKVRLPEGVLRQALSNLADNAVKYRRPEAAPEIEISGRQVTEGYELRVSDNGTGMSSDEARRAFEPFWRADHVRDVPGTGLGLSIVSRVVEASGGRVAVDSVPGRGTTFTISLPVAAREQPRGSDRV